MTVYVDDMRAPFRGMVMCHMIADTRVELDAMADKIGVARMWIQYPGTYREHYDIALSKRALAVKAGAKEITWSELGRRVKERQRTGYVGANLETWGCRECHEENPLDLDYCRKCGRDRV